MDETEQVDNNEEVAEDEVLDNCEAFGIDCPDEPEQVDEAITPLPVMDETEETQLRAPIEDSL